ncbi:BQ2448_1626 [Microbotryum intermedium]|uniref:BQ2448_1626 protein n=1 Tax=Microbotryum intermedium TaxID=269621 RepID=A0A238F8N4_9BASI|nr:BQ2448_1626 [Microbotryum intermedium]
MSTSKGLTNVLINIRKARMSTLPPCTCSRPRARARVDRSGPTSVAPLGNNSSLRHYSLSASAPPSPKTSPSTREKIPPKARPRTTLLAWLALPSFLGAIAYQQLASTDESKRPLSPDYFIPLTINKVTRLNHDNTLIELDLPNSLSPNQNNHGSAKNFSGQAPWWIHSIFVKQPELQIQRPYTPLNTTFLQPSSFSEDSSSTIQLLIKRYDDGEVSRYLHRLGPGDQVQIRGPVLTTELARVDRIVFIAGGTGITPAHQTITSFLQHPSADPPPAISILYAAQDPVLVESLEHLKKEAPFPVDLKVFSESTHPSKITADVLEREIGRAQGKPCLVVVCGPESMITDFAGPRARDLSQGPIGDVLARLGYTSQQVLKL